MTWPNLTAEEWDAFLGEDDRHISAGPQLIQRPLEWWYEQSLTEPEGHPVACSRDYHITIPLAVPYLEVRLTPPILDEK